MYELPMFELFYFLTTDDVFGYVSTFTQLGSDFLLK